MRGRSSDGGYNQNCFGYACNETLWLKLYLQNTVHYPSATVTYKTKRQHYGTANALSIHDLILLSLRNPYGTDSHPHIGSHGDDIDAKCNCHVPTKAE
jgi:hypothetical protein